MKPSVVSKVDQDNASVYLSIDDDEEDEFSWHLKKREYPPHKSHVLFYHQLD